MKLTIEQVEEIVKKVHKDLKLYHSDKYPIICNFRKPSNGLGNFDFPTWGGSFDYRDPEAVGDEINYGEFPEYIISIDDEKGEAFAYHYYTGHIRIKLNEQGNYEVVGKLYDYSKLGKQFQTPNLKDFGVFYTGHIRIKLNEKSNYEVVGKLYDYKEK